MKIGCAQFAPNIGELSEVGHNMSRAEAVLSKANVNAGDLDLLVLPELAFTGKNFSSLEHIGPFLEPTTSGTTALWAKSTALSKECVVVVGYPESVDVSKQPKSPKYYNSAMIFDRDGNMLTNYRKSHLDRASEIWALEGPGGFCCREIKGFGNVVIGICKLVERDVDSRYVEYWLTRNLATDLNPYKPESPWTTWEFAHYILENQPNLVILSMAWPTKEDYSSYSQSPEDPDMVVLGIWLRRLKPVINAQTKREIICVFANRTGVEGSVSYSGTSAVVGIQGGSIALYGMLGKGDKKLLIVDTSNPPKECVILGLETDQAHVDTESPTSHLSADEVLDDEIQEHPGTSKLGMHVEPLQALLNPSFRLDSTPNETDPKSTIGIHQDFSTAAASSLIKRPSSPKSRNCRRSRGLSAPPILGRA